MIPRAFRNCCDQFDDLFLSDRELKIAFIQNALNSSFQCWGIFQCLSVTMSFVFEYCLPPENKNIAYIYLEVRSGNT